MANEDTPELHDQIERRVQATLQRLAVAETAGGWNEWRRLVLDTAERHSEAIVELNRRQNGVDIQLAVIRGKSTVLGALGGALMGAIIAFVLHLLLKV